MFNLPNPTNALSALMITGLGKIVNIMKTPQIPYPYKLEMINEFSDALDRNAHQLSRNELSQYRDIAKNLYMRWLAMACYNWNYEQSVEYHESGICRYN